MGIATATACRKGAASGRPSDRAIASSKAKAQAAATAPSGATTSSVERMTAPISPGRFVAAYWATARIAARSRPSDASVKAISTTAMPARYASKAAGPYVFVTRSRNA